MEKKTPLKLISFYLLGLCLFLGAMELLCFVAFTYLRGKLTFFDFQALLTTHDYIKYVHQKFHPERGWDNAYATSFGERPCPVFYQEPFISVFGDSFVHCDGVEDNQTWEAVLAAMLKRDVYNFGTGGYGTDQAFLKFLSVFPKIHTPVVILGVTTENIKRLVNVYRPFYYPQTGIRLTKPRFVLDKGNLLLLANPVASIEDLPRLADPVFIEEIGKNDFWFTEGRGPHLGFPYSKILFNCHLWHEFLYRRKNSSVNDMEPKPYFDLWRDPQAASLMEKVLESFIDHARQQQATPIIMILPLKSDVVQKIQSRTDSAAEKQIAAICQKHHVYCINGINAFVQQQMLPEGIESLYLEHITEKGNKVIAAYTYKFLIEKGLLKNRKEVVD